jgi:multiple sugar transport system ATP-binding protein
MASVKFDQVYKIYPNGYVGVEDFNLDIANGEFVIFVGPSGCGKSTTMRMVAGLESISRGTISIGDRVVNGVTHRATVTSQWCFRIMRSTPTCRCARI